MRLMNVNTYEIHEFLSEDSNRKYAILSHTWGDEECSLQQMASPDVTTRKGYAKIEYCCEQAKEDGLEWAWVDTCCIDKTSTAEISEAINSMFRWYRDASVCYTYLSDVTSICELSSSRWFTRGWTLQELIAPRDIRFYSSDWKYLGSKIELQDQLWEITGIDRTVLSTGVFDQICTARRMSWAAKRQITRIEDSAYSLMGIFNVNMPLLYGEGKKAFTRLQEEIMKTSNDETLFAWGFPAELKDMWEFPLNETSPKTGLLATSPADFSSKHETRVLDILQSDTPPIVFNKGLRISLLTIPANDLKFAIIACTVDGYYEFYLGIPLLKWSERYVARCGDLVLINARRYPFIVESQVKRNKSTEILFIKPPVPVLPRLAVNAFIIQENFPKDQFHYILDDVRGPRGMTYLRDTQTIRFPAYKKWPLVAIFYTSMLNDPPFALVVGSDMEGLGGAYARFVPILPEDSTPGDFYTPLPEDAHLVPMTKSQLISHLVDSNNKPLLLQDKKQRFSQTIGYWTMAMKLMTTKQILEARERVNHLGSCYKISLRVNFREIPINLIEKTIVISTSIKRQVKKGSPKRVGSGLGL